jgi:hypothetical protein
LLCFLDAYSGYHQIKMKESDQLATSFITPLGMFCYVTMSFSLRNTGATYQHCMQHVFGDHTERTVEAYVDDIVVKTRKADDLVSDLGIAFGCLRANGVKLNPEKCVFGVPRGMLLGYIVSLGGHAEPSGAPSDPAGAEPMDEDPSNEAYVLSLLEGYGSYEADVMDIEPAPVKADWRDKYIAWMARGELPSDRAAARRTARMAKSFALVDGELYKRAASGILQRCVPIPEGRELLRDIHAGICGHHAAPRTLVGNAFRQGFY